MNFKKIFLYGLVLAGAVVLGSCTLPRYCQPDALVAPQLQSPAMWEVVNSLQPSLTWRYPTTVLDISKAGGPAWAQPKPPMPGDVPTPVPGGPTTVPSDGPTPVPGGSPTTVPGDGPTPVPGVGPTPVGVPTAMPGTDGPIGPIPYYFPYYVPYYFKPYIFWPYVIWFPYGGVKTYPTSRCSPEGYRITLQTGPGFSDELGGETSNTNWSPSTPLQPNTEYRWGVSAVSRGGVGPFSGYRYFFTGPLCECKPGALSAPTLNSLPSSVKDLMPGLSWDYPGDCLPQGYRIDLSTDPNFADTSLSGGTGNPWRRWMPGEKLADCTVYYWRVAAVCEQEGGGTLIGPYSETQSFSTHKMKICPTVVPFAPQFIPGINANCRKGPDTRYGLLGVAVPGQGIPIVGRNEAGDWYYVNLRDDLLCWIAGSTGEAEGDTDGLPVIEYEPLDVNKEKPGLQCGQYTDPKRCGNVFGCYWDWSDMRCRKR